MKRGDKIGRYELAEEIGEGAMANVFTSRHPVLDRRVAIKVLKQEACHDSHYVARFLEDAQAAHGLDHPNIVRVYDVDEADGRPFIVMELVEGQSLDMWMVGRKVAVREAVRIARDVARALSAAHAGGLVHRDVKPSNILLDQNTGVAKLTDFGAAKRDRPGAAQLTEVGQRIGTPRYMAPEQVEGAAVDARTDLFALGTTLYELLAGRPAFEATSVSAAFHAILFTAPPPLAELRPDAPAELVALVERLIAKAPDDRPSSAAEIATALDGLLEVEATATKAQPFAEAPAPSTVHGSELGADDPNPAAGGIMLRSRLVQAVAGVVVLMVVALGAWWWLTPGSEPEVALVTEPEGDADATPEAPEEAEPAPEAPEEAEPVQAEADPAPEVPDESAEPATETAVAPEPEPEVTEESGTLTPEPEPEVIEESAAGEPDAEVAPEPESAEVAARWEPDPAEGTEAPGPDSGLAPGSEAAEAKPRWEPEPGEAGDALDPSASDLTAQLTPGIAGAPPEPESAPEALVEIPECPADGATPGCALAADALEAMAATPVAGPVVNLNQPDGIYLDQEYLVVEMQLPEQLGGYVYVDVLTDAGSVYHLLPEPLRADNQLPAGGVMRVGVEAEERREGVRHWQVSAPFGDAYLLVLVSEKPIYDGLRPIAEPLDDYRDVLLGALGDPDSGGKAVYLRRVEFRPR